MTKMWARNNRPGRKDNFHITAEEFYTRLSEHTHTQHFDFHAGAFMKPYADNIKFDYIVKKNYILALLSHPYSIHNVLILEIYYFLYYPYILVNYKLLENNYL